MTAEPLRAPDAPVPMFDLARPHEFHVELTDKCNAGCPLCPRTDAMNFCKPDRSRVFNVELGLDLIRRQFDDAMCARTGLVVFSGAYGDPIAASELLEIVDHLTARGVRVAISTNGGLRRPAWWRKLGEALKRTDSRVELHVDGLADTNPLYRVHTDFDRIMANAAACIATGARVEWHFIAFRHNQHQIREVADLAREMGFADFVLIDSIRFSKRQAHPYRTPDGKLRTLEPPSIRTADQLPPGVSGEPPLRTDARGPERALEVNGIRCKSAALNRAYISAHGIVSACCWVTGSTDEARLLAENGIDPARHDIHLRPLSEILADEPFASLYARNWAEDRLDNCRRKCGLGFMNRRRSAAPAADAAG